MAKKEQATLLELCVARAGGGWRDISRGSKVALFIGEWAIAASEQDEPLSVLGFIRYWKLDDTAERRTWRRLGEFKELFPEYENPQPFVASFEGAVRSKNAAKDALRVIQLPVEGLPA